MTPHNPAINQDALRAAPVTARDLVPHAEGWREISPAVRRINRMLNRAVKSGVVKKPAHCEKCGISPLPKRNGASSLEGHHPDYSKPLEVQWLCTQCHRDITPVSHRAGPSLPGESHPSAKLTTLKVIEIKKRYAAGEGIRALGRAFGVSKTTIRDIVNGKWWRHLWEGEKA